MLERLAENTGQLDYLDGLISGEEVGTFKPHPAVYTNALNHVDCGMDDLLMVASHSWDVSGGANVGMRTAFVNRRHVPIEPLGSELRISIWRFTLSKNWPTGCANAIS